MTGRPLVGGASFARNLSTVWIIIAPKQASHHLKNLEAHKMGTRAVRFIVHFDGLVIIGGTLTCLVPPISNSWRRI